MKTRLGMAHFENNLGIGLLVMGGDSYPRGCEF